LIAPWFDHQRRLRILVVTDIDENECPHTNNFLKIEGMQGSWRIEKKIEITGVRNKRNV
jgi:hypothetical protein